MRGKIFLALVVVAAAVVAVGPAFAGCNPTKEFATEGFAANDYFIVFNAGEDTDPAAGVIGHVWQPGSFATTNETTGNGCPDTVWLVANGVYGSNGGDLGFGICDTAVCPSGSLIVVVQTKTLDGKSASYTVGRVNEGGVIAFDYARTGSNWNMTPIPRPRLLTSSRAGTDVVSDVALDAPDPAFHGAGASADTTATSNVTGYQLVTFTGTADPGRAAALWTPLGAAINSATPSSPGVHFNCSDTTKDVFVANRVVFVDNVLSDYVSAPTVVRCSNLANPGSPKIKPIGKKKITP